MSILSWTIYVGRNRDFSESPHTPTRQIAQLTVSSLGGTIMDSIVRLRMSIPEGAFEYKPGTVSVRADAGSTALPPSDGATSLDVVGATAEFEVGLAFFEKPRWLQPRTASERGSKRAALSIILCAYLHVWTCEATRSYAELDIDGLGSSGSIIAHACANLKCILYLRMYSRT